MTPTPVVLALVTGGRTGLEQMLENQRAEADRIGDGAALDAWADRIEQAS